MRLRSFYYTSVLLCLATVASASESAERLYSRGLVEFHAQRYPQALALFEDAVREDPNDSYALYYRGVTHGRMEKYEAAIADLQAALERRPDLAQAPLELGVALVQNGQNTEALPWLEQAQRNQEQRAMATLFLGIAHLRLDQPAQARPLFVDAGADPSLDVASRYYQGVVDFREAKWTDAQEQFEYVVATDPGSAYGREAASFIDRLRTSSAPPKYRLYGGVGFQYDSNVLLAPSDNAIKQQFEVGKQEDGRFTLNGGATYSLLRTDNVNLSVGYDFFQSLHLDLHDFDLQDHRPGIQLVVDEGPVRIGILGRYDYYLRDGNSFLQEATAMPWITVAAGGEGRTEIFYRMRFRDFIEEPFDGVRDAFNHGVGVRQFIYLGSQERSLAVGYRFDSEDPTNSFGDEFGYDGHEVNGGLAWTFPWEISAEADYLFRHESYSTESSSESPMGSKRRDKEHNAIVVFSKILTPYLRVTTAYFLAINDSNKDAFEYDRHIGSLAFEVRY